MSRLEKNSVEFRKKEIARNTFNENKEYNSAHPNALSDGDEHGKGELNESIGGETDIKKRKELKAKNLYNENHQYDDSTA